MPANALITAKKSHLCGSNFKNTQNATGIAQRQTNA